MQLEEAVKNSGSSSEITKIIDKIFFRSHSNSNGFSSFTKFVSGNRIFDVDNLSSGERKNIHSEISVRL